MLTIHNDEEVDFTSYEGGNLAGRERRATALIIASGPNPDNETYTVTFQPGAGKWRRWGWKWCRTKACRESGWRAARTAW